MRSLTSVADYLGIVAGLLFGAIGLILHGGESVILWCIFGYFVGKTLQSLTRTASYSVEKA